MSGTCKIPQLTWRRLLTGLSRVARYAALYARSNPTAAPSAPSSQAANSSKADSNAPQTSPRKPTQASRGLSTRSSIETLSLETTKEHINADQRDRGWSSSTIAESPLKSGLRQPSIFPGVVRQWTRRKSLRQSSGSEKDYSASGGSGVGLSSSGILEPDGKGPSLTVPEETDSR